jgi:hypothetical protein
MRAKQSPPCLAPAIWQGKNGFKTVLLREPVKGLWPPSGNDWN